MTADIPVSGSAGRALVILALVLDHGPVSPARLTRMSGLSRTAVHRAIHALIDRGFIRYQLGKMHVIVTDGLQAQVRDAFFSPPGIDTISRTVDEALKHRRLQCDIAVLTAEGNPRVVESTAPDMDVDMDYFESDLVSVLLSHFDPVEVTRITARALRETGGTPQVNPEFLDRFRQAQYQGYLWDSQFGALSVRLDAQTDMACAIRLFSRNDARLPRKEAVAALEAMHMREAGVFPHPVRLGL